MGNILFVKVIYTTPKSSQGVSKAFCADSGYRKTFVANVESVLDLSVDISPKIKAVDFKVIPKRWVIERTFNSRR